MDINGMLNGGGTVNVPQQRDEIKANTEALERQKDVLMAQRDEIAKQRKQIQDMMS